MSDNHSLNNSTTNQTFRIDITASTVPYGTAKISVGTTQSWSEQVSFIPTTGELVVYSDRTVDGDVVYPGLKIGDGHTRVGDLPFVGDDSAHELLEMINQHISDLSAHLVPGERELWNNKVSCRIDGERLIFEAGGL